MKKGLFKNIGVLAVVLSLVTVTMLSGTLAKYTSAVTGTAGKVPIAKWEFKAGNNASDTKTDSFTLTLTPKQYSNVTTDKIAPGTEGSFQVYATNGSEVDANYTIAIDVTNMPTNVEFYNGTRAEANKLALIESGDKKTITISGKPLVKATGIDTTTILWDWPEGTTETDQDTIATGLVSMSVGVTVTGTQATPTPTGV